MSAPLSFAPGFTSHRSERRSRIVRRALRSAAIGTFWALFAIAFGAVLTTAVAMP